MVLWKKNSNGYCIVRENAGIYLERDLRDGYHGTETNLPVLESVIDPFFKELYYHEDAGGEVQLLPNTVELHDALGLEMTSRGLKRK
jgi:hypothetical protein